MYSSHFGQHYYLLVNLFKIKVFEKKLPYCVEKWPIFLRLSQHYNCCSVFSDADILNVSFHDFFLPYMETSYQHAK